MTSIGMLRVIPQYSERVWGGQRLRPGSPPVGEAWLVWEENLIASGAFAGRTLADVAAECGAELLGAAAVRQTAARFPLLIKLLDTAEWLSVQVHPRNEQAERLEGAGHFGKTEAWYILEAEAGAQLIAGLRPEMPVDALERAIRGGTLLDWVRYLPVQAGDTVFVEAGTIHALGPGLLLYEVQQTSDITYRVFDWNRPQAAGRALHLDQSIAVTNLDARPDALSAPALADGTPVTLTSCPYFQLELLSGASGSIPLDTERRSFHAFTVTEGKAVVEASGSTETLERFETVIIPANVGPYTVRSDRAFRGLLAYVPAGVV